MPIVIGGVFCGRRYDARGDAPCYSILALWPGLAVESHPLNTFVIGIASAVRWPQAQAGTRLTFLNTYEAAEMNPEQVLEPMAAALLACSLYGAKARRNPKGLWLS